MQFTESELRSIAWLYCDDYDPHDNIETVRLCVAERCLPGSECCTDNYGQYILYTRIQDEDFEE